MCVTNIINKGAVCLNSTQADAAPGWRTNPPLAATAVLALAGLGLTACGGSSSSSTGTTATAASASASAGGSGPGGFGATGSGATGPRAGRFKALRECLQKNGITLPSRTPGQRPPGGFAGGAGTPQLPAGVTRAKYEAAVKKCGGAPFVGAGRRIRSPVVEQALTKFAACMRENGVNVPAPNTSGSGPVFNTKGLNTTSTTFQQAESKCRAILQDAFRRGAPGGGPPTGTPPSGGQSPERGGAAG